MRKVVVLGGQSEGYAYEIAALSSFSDVEFVVFPSTKKEDALAVVQDAEVILFTATQIDAELIDKMEESDLPLEESFALYKKGVSLVEVCNKKIEKVECDIRKVTEQ